MTEMKKSVIALENKPETGIRTTPFCENRTSHGRTVVALRKELLKARNDLAAFENALEDRQLEFDALVQARQTKTPQTAENDLVRRENRLAVAILETEYATMRMISALATLNERLTSEYAITRQFTNGTYTPPPQRKNRSG